MNRLVCDLSAYVSLPHCIETSVMWTTEKFGSLSSAQKTFVSDGNCALNSSVSVFVSIVGVSKAEGCASCVVVCYVVKISVLWGPIHNRWSATRLHVVWVCVCVYLCGSLLKTSCETCTIYDRPSGEKRRSAESETNVVREHQMMCMFRNIGLAAWNVCEPCPDWPKDLRRQGIVARKKVRVGGVFVHLNLSSTCVRLDDGRTVRALEEVRPPECIAPFFRIANVSVCIWMAEWIWIRSKIVLWLHIHTNTQHSTS